MKMNWKTILLVILVMVLLTLLVEKYYITPHVEDQANKQKHIIWSSVAKALSECTRKTKFNKPEIEWLSLDSGRFKFDTISDTVYFKMDKNLQPFDFSYITTVYVSFDCISTTETTRNHIKMIPRKINKTSN